MVAAPSGDEDYDEDYEEDCGEDGDEDCDGADDEPGVVGAVVLGFARSMRQSIGENVT